MKKAIYSLLITLLFIPVLVCASTFDNAGSLTKRYIKNFLYPERYIKVESGDFISKEEVEQTMVRKDSDNRPLTVSSYMYEGTRFWAKNRYVISEIIEQKPQTDNYKTKVTQIVKHDTKVKGTGKFTDPWMFIDSFKVTVKVGSGEGTIDGALESTKSVDASGIVTFGIAPKSGYKYLNNTCGEEPVGSTLTVRNVEKDIECIVNFAEEKYSYTLDTPCKAVTTKKYGERTHCFSNAEPQTFYALYKLGYYRDNELKERLGKVLSPALIGWTFKGYYVEDNTLINANGYFESTYELLDDTKTDNNIKFDIEPNQYTVALSCGEGATNSLNSVVATYDHDMPEPILLPKKPGYVFTGYYKNDNAGEDKYYNGNGEVDSSCEPWNQPNDSTIHAAYRKCKAGYYCPTGNDETPCPIGTYQNEEGQTSCKPCSAGHYQSEEGQTSCPACAVAWYQPNTGQSSCIQCPSGYRDTSGTGSTKIQDCRYWDSCNYTVNTCSGCYTSTCSGGYVCDTYSFEGSHCYCGGLAENCCGCHQTSSPCNWNGCCTGSPNECRGAYVYHN